MSVQGKTFPEGSMTVSMCENICCRFCDCLYEWQHLPQVLWMSVRGKSFSQVLWHSLWKKTFAAGSETVCMSEEVCHRFCDCLPQVLWLSATGYVTVYTRKTNLLQVLWLSVWGKIICHRFCDCLHSSKKSANIASGSVTVYTRENICRRFCDFL